MKPRVSGTQNGDTLVSLERDFSADVEGYEVEVIEKRRGVLEVIVPAGHPALLAGEWDSLVTRFLDAVASYDGAPYETPTSWGGGYDAEAMATIQRTLK